MHILIKFALVIICLSSIKNGKMDMGNALLWLCPHTILSLKGREIIFGEQVEGLSMFSKGHHQFTTPQKSSAYCTLANCRR